MGSTVSRLGIGTAQFGSNYGISNTNGKVSKIEVAKILGNASESKISLIDTATSYGSCEKLLGELIESEDLFKIITKTPVAKALKVKKPDKKTIIDSFARSLEQLNKSYIYGLLVHSAKDLVSNEGRCFIDALIELRQLKLVQKIGVSIYSGSQIDQVLSVFTPDIVQVPFNAADRRLEYSGHLNTLKRHGIEVHARSIFLQGLLLMDRTHLPNQFKELEHEFSLFQASAKRSEVSVLEACIYAAMIRPELDRILVGVTSVLELRQIIDSCCRIDKYKKKPELYSPIIKNKHFIDPSRWRL